MRTCDWICDHLDGLVDGDLSADETREVEQHLQTCDACRAEWDGLQSLLHEARSLPKRMNPERDLWPDIVERLPKRTLIDWQRHARTAVYAAGIAAMVIVAVSLGMARSPEVPGRPATIATERPVVSEPLKEDRAILREAYHARADALDPELRSVIDSNLVIIDESLDELRRAMELAPDNARLEHLYVAACRSELDMLRQAVHLGQEG